MLNSSHVGQGAAPRPKGAGRLQSQPPLRLRGGGRAPLLFGSVSVRLCLGFGDLEGLVGPDYGHEREPGLHEIDRPTP